jgi:hypothetical protein
MVRPLSGALWCTCSGLWIAVQRTRAGAVAWITLIYDSAVAGRTLAHDLAVLCGSEGGTGSVVSWWRPAWTEAVVVPIYMVYIVLVYIYTAGDIRETCTYV